MKTYNNVYTLINNGQISFICNLYSPLLLDAQSSLNEENYAHKHVQAFRFFLLIPIFQSIFSHILFSRFNATFFCKLESTQKSNHDCASSATNKNNHQESNVTSGIREKDS